MRSYLDIAVLNVICAIDILPNQGVMMEDTNKIYLSDLGNWHDKIDWGKDPVDKKYTKEDFMPKLLPHHKHLSERAYKRLSGKISNLRGSLKKRALDAGLKFDVTTKQLRTLFYNSYGKKCKYCGSAILKLNRHNQITCDHIIPIQKGGDSTIDNLQLICATCNRRKSSLLESDFLTIIRWIDNQNEDIKTFLLKQMAKGGEY